MSDVTWPVEVSGVFSGVARRNGDLLIIEITNEYVAKKFEGRLNDKATIRLDISDNERAL